MASSAWETVAQPRRDPSPEWDQAKADIDGEIAGSVASERGLRRVGEAQARDEPLATADHILR